MIGRKDDFQILNPKLKDYLNQNLINLKIKSL